MKRLMMTLVFALGAGALFGEQYYDGERLWSLERSEDLVSEEWISYFTITDVTPKPKDKLEIPYRLGDFNIIGIGSGAFANASNLTEVVIGDGILYIEDGAFADCVKLADITLPSGMSEIDCDAFSGTRAEEKAEGKEFVIGEYLIKYTGDREKYTVPEEVKMICDYAFYYSATNKEGVCLLREVVIPEGVETIGCGAFRPKPDRESALEKIELPDSVTEVGFGAFAHCWALKTLALGAGITELGYVFYGGCGESDLYSIIDEWFDDGVNYVCNYVETLKLGDGVKVIPESLFCNRGWYALNTVVFGAALEEIGSSAFQGLSTLSNVDFTAATALKTIGTAAFAESSVTKVDLSTCTGLTKLPVFAFCNCAELEKVTFPEGLKTIGAAAFSNCDKLAGVTFNEGLELIDSAAFYSCDALEKLEFPSTLKTIGGSCSMQVEQGWDSMEFAGAFASCEKLARVTFNEGLETIGSEAFLKCVLLEKLDFPSTLLSIGSSAFDGCAAVTKIAFAEGSVLEELGSSAFANLTNLSATVEIPASVTTIDGYLFDGCEKLEKVTGGDGVVECWDSMFGNCPFAHFGEFDIDGKPYGKGKIVTFGKVVIGLRGECPKSIDADDFGEDIVQIAPSVFASYNNATVSNLTAVTFPETLTKIGSSAFYGAKNLRDVAFGEDASDLEIGSSAFWRTGLKELEGTFASVGYNAFANCLNLTDVKVSVETRIVEDEDGWWTEGGYVWEDAFAGCTNLVSADITATGATRTQGDKSYTYGGEIWGCFSGCPKLEKVRLVADEDIVIYQEYCPMFGKYDVWVETSSGWGYYLTYETAAVEELEIDAPVVPYGLAAYQPKLSKVTLGEKIEIIEDSAFEGCEKLDRITIPSAVAYIGRSAFEGCTGLRNVEGCEGLQRVEYKAFENTDFVNSAKRGALQVAGVLFRWVDGNEGETAEIDGSVTVIAANAFTSNKIAKVVVPASVEKIRDYTFIDCPDLEAVVFGNADVKLGVDAASNCPKLTWVASKGGFFFQGFAGEFSFACCDDHYSETEWYGDQGYGFNYYLAQFEKVRFHNDPRQDGSFMAGSTYVGWIMRDGAVVGSITVKTSKLDGQGRSKVSATVQLPGSKKSYTTLFKVGEDGKAYSDEGYYSDLYGMILGGTWMSGSLNLGGAEYTVRGGSDVAKTGVFDTYAGRTWVAALSSEGEDAWSDNDDTYCALCRGFSSLVIAPSKRGRVKVTGLLADGTKVSTTAQMVAGDNGMVAAPVTLQLYSGKKGGFSFLLQFYMDNGKPCMYFDDWSADGSIGTWYYELPNHWKAFASVNVWVTKVGEVDVNSAGFKTPEAEMGMLLESEALTRSCRGFEPYLASVEIAVDAAKGKWSLPKASKWSLLAKPEQYAALLAENPFGGTAPDGKIIEAYAYDYGTVIEMGNYTYFKPTHWWLVDVGAKLDKKTGTLTEGKNTNHNAWKLSYKKKTGQFNGAATYRWVDMSNAQKHAMKTGKMTVAGVMIDGEAYGTAVVKGVCSLKVMDLEQLYRMSEEDW